MVEDKKVVLDLGFTRQQGYYALKKAKMGLPSFIQRK
jgi:hypothetical protein